MNFLRGDPQFKRRRELRRNQTDKKLLLLKVTPPNLPFARGGNKDTAHNMQEG